MSRGRKSPRQVAYTPRLGYAIIANPLFLYRSARRPEILRQRSQYDRTTAQRALSSYDSGSFFDQTRYGSYPSDGPDRELGAFD